MQVMYELVTLGRRWSYAKLSTRRYKKYRKWDYNAIPDFQTKPFSQVNSSRPKDGEFHPYSSELMDLVKECMKPRKSERISPEELRRQTQTQIRRYVDDSEARLRERKGSHDRSAQDAENQLLNESKVYFAANEINDLNVGSEKFIDCDGNVILDSRKLSEAKDDVANLLGANTDPDWDELHLPKQFDRRAKAWRRKQGGKAANRHWNDICRTTDDQIRFEDSPSNALRQYRPLFPPSPEAKPSHELSRGSLTEDDAPDSDSTTTSESEGELIRKLTRKRKREHDAYATETNQDDAGPRGVAIATEADLQDPARSGAAADTTEGEETVAESAQANTAGNAQDKTVQPAPAVAPQKTQKAKIAAAPRPTRDQPPRRVKKTEERR